MNLEVVIGANYGDEGKGLFTEYLCRNKPKPLVVLSNGGCQRGHTVYNPEKKIRHVFQHFGSGSLVGISTVFSRTYLLNPIKFIQEKKELENAGIFLKSFRTPSGALQLPGDMVINHLLEENRAHRGNRHGSCGWGIWETKVRNKEHSRLTFEDFASMDYVSKKKCIRESLEWQIENRLKEFHYGIDNSLLDTVLSDGFCNHFIDDFEQMTKDAILLESDNLIEVNWSKHGIDVETFVIENGQGLLLDMEYAPKDENGLTDVHSTPSRCGMQGAWDALGNINGFTDVHANYISRTYFTRHGDGPFPEETVGFSKEDKTNVFNEHQGHIRFGKMTIRHAEEIRRRIESDSRRCNWSIVFTHCNEEPTVDSAFDGIDMFKSFEENSKNIVHFLVL